MRIGPDRDRNPVDRARADVPLWRQAVVGIGLVTAGALAAIVVGVLLAAVVTWLF